MVAAWIDTEGTYQTRAGDTSCVIIAQKERAPLEGIRLFLERAGIPASLSYRIKKNPKRGYYVLRTGGGVEAMAKIIINTEEYIRTRNKRRQIARFRKRISETTSHENVHKRRARQILGLDSRTSGAYVQEKAKVDREFDD